MGDVSEQMEHRPLGDLRMQRFVGLLKIGSVWRHNSHARCVATIVRITGSWVVYRVGETFRETSACSFLGAFRPR